MNEFILPDIGEGIVECELLEWLVKEGEVIAEDQPVAEVMTDKATVQIPSMHAGKVTKLYYQRGDIAKVHEPLFAMDVDTQHNIEQPATETKANTASVDSNNTSIEAFVLPDIGEGIVECEIVKWLVAEGDEVNEDDVVVEVMTDKAVVEIPAKHQGKIVKLHYAQGDIAKVHSILFEQAIHNGEAINKPEQSEAITPPHEQTPVHTTSTARNASKVLASPAVRRVAREENVDLSKVVGSGKKGRVMKQDIFAYQQQSSSVSQKASSAPKSIPIKGIKAAMAKHMQDCVSSIPHFSVSDELLMDNLIALRETLKPQFQQTEVKLSFMPLFIKALSLSLLAFPEINARVNEDVSELMLLDDHNIGIAVDSPAGLMVPNIKQVQNLSIFEIAKELNRLTEAARQGRLSQSDMQDGTITISNIGVLGGITATPVINKPELAIVALGKTQRLPRFDSNDHVYAAQVMQINWSGDHRVIDGATMVRFNNKWMDYLQNPEKMLVELK